MPFISKNRLTFFRSGVTSSTSRIVLSSSRMTNRKTSPLSDWAISRMILQVGEVGTTSKGLRVVSRELDEWELHRHSLSIVQRDVMIDAQWFHLTVYIAMQVRLLSASVDTTRWVVLLTPPSPHLPR
jgi:hypothetical protein